MGRNSCGSRGGVKAVFSLDSNSDSARRQLERVLGHGVVVTAVGRVRRLRGRTNRRRLVVVEVVVLLRLSGEVIKASGFVQQFNSGGADVAVSANRQRGRLAILAVVGHDLEALVGDRDIRTSANSLTYATTTNTLTRSLTDLLRLRRVKRGSRRRSDANAMLRRIRRLSLGRR